uniref:Rad60/SUMO-like domain-containing protein n=1 Tax=Catharus ustulatus TaxID=91951 RepID=A0A8C3U232_CATUS
MSKEKPRGGVKTENEPIDLKVAGQDGSVVQFRIKRRTPLGKLMKAFSGQLCQGLTILTGKSCNQNLSSVIPLVF